MEGVEILQQLKELGGWGVAGFVIWLYRQERGERIRYRDFHEETIRSFPALTQAVNELSELIERKWKR